MFSWRAGPSPAKDASTSGGPTGIAVRAESLLDKIRSVRYVLTLIGISSVRRPGRKPARGRCGCLKCLDYNLARESEARQIFLAFFGCNPLKSPDSENYKRKRKKAKESHFAFFRFRFLSPEFARWLQLPWPGVGP
jgi:hypothetical protein